jgi:hypothetical protein
MSCKIGRSGKRARVNSNFNRTGWFSDNKCAGETLIIYMK